VKCRACQVVFRLLCAVSLGSILRTQEVTMRAIALTIALLASTAAFAEDRTSHTIPLDDYDPIHDARWSPKKGMPEVPGLRQFSVGKSKIEWVSTSRSSPSYSMLWTSRQRGFRLAKQYLKTVRKRGRAWNERAHTPIYRVTFKTFYEADQVYRHHSELNCHPSREQVLRYERILSKYGNPRPTIPEQNTHARR